ncbi:LPS biosynthesis glycosyltransferase [Aureimonas sp. ME7]|uniref:LPS biosynthesis glycosyltransferase n=1 Tax=Aureimonas sp. ME7 TaxID=2744252 RepID=UPI0015F6D5AA|nr:LPS biosynthesis glycosyltransferase [Aureimonas sp. ME7]
MLNAFERRFVINLRERTDRRSETEAELGRIGASAEFVAATRPVETGGFSSIGEHGAYLSHLELWRRSVGCASILVMEDDVAFDRGGRVAEFDAAPLPPDWDILYLGHMQHPSVRREWRETGLVAIAPDAEFIGLHCYAVNGCALERLAAAAARFLARERGHPDGGVMPIDGALNIARRQEGFRTYALMPPLAHQRASRTDIGALKWFDRMPALAGAMRLARRAKDGLRHAGAGR